MSRIHFDQTTTLSPEQYVAGLTDFGPGRAKVFSKSADDYLKVHHLGSAEADVTKVPAASGSDCTTTGQIPTTSSSRPPTRTSGGRVRLQLHLHPVTRRVTDVDVVIVREGKNAKGRFLGLVLGSVGKGSWQGVRQQRQGDRGPQQRGADPVTIVTTTPTRTADSRRRPH